MSAAPIRAVLFDLDGTLLDTAPDLVGSLNHLRHCEGLPAVAVDEFRRYASQGALGLIGAGMPAGDARLTEERKDRFLAHYARNSCVATQPFAGVDELLERLEAAAVPWVIVTNKPEYLTLPLLEHLGWSRRPAGVVCGDTLRQRKPDPEPLLLACTLSGVEPRHALMVGDDLRDLQAATAARMRAALALYGYGAEEVLNSGYAEGLRLADPRDLLALVLGDGSAARP